MNTQLKVYKVHLFNGIIFEVVENISSTLNQKLFTNLYKKVDDNYIFSQKNSNNRTVMFIKKDVVFIEEIALRDVDF